MEKKTVKQNQKIFNSKWSEIKNLVWEQNGDHHKNVYFKIYFGERDWVSENACFQMNKNWNNIKFSKLNATISQNFLYAMRDKRVRMILVQWLFITVYRKFWGYKSQFRFNKNVLTLDLLAVSWQISPFLRSSKIDWDGFW